MERDTPPAPDGSPATTDALRELYPTSKSTTSLLFGRDTALREYMALKAQKKELELRIRQIENTIKADLGVSESGLCGPYRISWKSRTRRSFQENDFIRDHPDLDLTPYFKYTELRPFQVTEQITEAV